LTELEPVLDGEVLATELVIVDGATSEKPDMTVVDLDGIAARLSITRTR
jgi:hypothetical protein